jgi:hypothetical protein
MNDTNSAIAQQLPGEYMMDLQQVIDTIVIASPVWSVAVLGLIFVCAAYLMRRISKHPSN